jgi:F-type H+-transporting ATPase subunit gamma
MAGAKEIRTKIKSVKSTQKITKAMEKVATSKMRKAQVRMAAAKPYAHKIREMMGHLANASPDFRHPYLVARPVKKVAYLVVTSDRGLCGGLNTNLLRQVARSARDFKEQGVEVSFALVGAKGTAFFKRFGGEVLAEVSKLGDAPHLDQLVGVLKVLTNAFSEANVDKVILASTDFVNTMTQKPTLQTLLPLEAVKSEGMRDNWDYLYEPSAESLLDFVLNRYLESQVYQAVVENTACEQAARMVAMKAATDNAGKIISSLQLAYNRARQAAITKEISEIVGGAAAV